ncbi:hypothetical protein C1H46_013392 [Malus baccata]|uniref:Uncharacterized protein n=1 Tax=Malus baccata TaxID=106549 RepID=A0A540MQ06_MALBA|nr:hypothetical protein C1H46_013392 [Malus baccata]
MGVERYYRLANGWVEMALNATIGCLVGCRKSEKGLLKGGEEQQKYSGGRLCSSTTSGECVARAGLGS